jgi:adenylate kinase family enzyme
MTPTKASHLAEPGGNQPAGRLPGPRIAVVGLTGSGKSTLAGQLAALLEVPRVELDALHWQPGWQELALEPFRAQVARATAGPAWVVDGNYSKVRDLVWSRATTLVWLDYSLLVVLPQLFWRTLRRIRTREVLWNGNLETWRGTFLSRDSLLVWALKTYGRHRREYPRLLAQPEYAHLDLIRLTSRAATERWLAWLARQPEINR